MTLPSLRLKANAERRLRAGHLWVYSNEVDVAATPLNAFAAGDQAVLEMANGKPLGIVALSPNNLICGRLISRDTKHVLDKSLLVHRINIALSLRERLFDKPFYRLVYGDSDLLPGLVVDRFGDVLVVQLASAAMELRKDEVLAPCCRCSSPPPCSGRTTPARATPRAWSATWPMPTAKCRSGSPWKRTA